MLDHRQQKVLTYIESYQAASGGVSPSFEDIAKGCQLASKGTVSRLMDHLETSGYIRRIPQRWRGIEVLKSTQPKYKVFRWDDERKELVPLK